jgi:hypothetical protein
MELIEQKFVKNNIVLGVLIFLMLNSCQTRMQEGKLECILNNIEVDANGMDIEVGQHNGWTDTTTLILVTYHKKSLGIPIDCNLKGRYKGTDIYFYQSNVDTLDRQQYVQIPNNISWNNFIQEIDEDFFQPPYDPVEIQVEYNDKRKCFGNVIKGKGYINGKIISECKCEY